VDTQGNEPQNLLMIETDTDWYLQNSENADCCFFSKSCSNNI